MSLEITPVRDQDSILKDVKVQLTIDFPFDLDDWRDAVWYEINQDRSGSWEDAMGVIAGPCKWCIVDTIKTALDVDPDVFTDSYVERDERNMMLVSKFMFLKELVCSALPNKGHEPEQVKQISFSK